MAIKKITNDTEFRQDMLICVGRNGSRTVSGPVPISKVSDGQITVISDGRKRNVRRSTISGYVVDTEEEGMGICNLLLDRDMAIQAAESKAAAEARKKVLAEWRPKVTALLGNEENT
jgi:hypothetical protein